MAEDYKTRTPGQILRAARERREQSLHDASEGTKISVRLLEAIERDEYHKLSGPLYVKSFLRNYAGWLDLDAEEVLAVYELATGRPEQTVSTEDEVWNEDQVSVTRVGMAWGRLVAIAVAATVVLVVLVVLALRFLGGGDEQQELPPTADAAAPVEQRRTVVTRAEPSPGDSTLAATVADERAREDAAPGEAVPSGVVSETQPDQRTETSEERLARLTQDRFGGPVDDTEPPDQTPAEPPATEPAAVQESSAPAAAPAVASDLAPPRRGDPELRFTGGEAFPLVLRVLMPEPANCTVRRDDQADAVPVIWPDHPGPPPAYNLRHGLAYAVQGGYAIYWGAEDHFTLTLDRIQDVEITLNGHPQSRRGWRPGQTKLLDGSSLPAGGG